MTPMPTSVKVGPHTYAVLIKPAREMTKTDGKTDLGVTHFDRLEIWIKWKMRHSKNQEVLWHEVKHCCTYPDYIGVRKTDEEWIDRTASTEVAVMQENPELLAYLTA